MEAGNFNSILRNMTRFTGQNCLRMMVIVVNNLYLHPWRHLLTIIRPHSQVFLLVFVSPARLPLSSRSIDVIELTGVFFPLQNVPSCWAIVVSLPGYSCLFLWSWMSASLTRVNTSLDLSSSEQLPNARLTLRVGSRPSNCLIPHRMMRE